MLAERVDISVSLDWASQFTNYLEHQGKSERTVSAYLQDVRIFSGWFELRNGEPLQPCLINGIDLRAYRRFSIEEEQMRPSTWNRRLASLRALSGWAFSTGALNVDPSKDLKVVNQVELPPRWLAQGDVSRLLRRCEINVNGTHNGAHFVAMRDQAMIVMMVYAGLRESEICGLDLSDVQLNERSGKVVIRRGKGEKRREVPLHLEARRALSLWLGMRGDAAGALFIGEKNSADRLTTRTVQRRVAEIGRQVGLMVTPHDLRHTFAKRCLDAGGQLTEVSILLGHARLSTTARYVQPGWGDLEECVGRV